MPRHVEGADIPPETTNTTKDTDPIPPGAVGPDPDQKLRDQKLPDQELPDQKLPDDLKVCPEGFKESGVDYRIIFPQSIRFDHDGKYVTMSVNNKNQIVTVFHHSNFSSVMYYCVGELIPSKDTIKWGDKHRYDNGGFPRVSMNSSGLLVEVHESPHRRKFWYRVGVVNEDKTIDWGKSYENGSGRLAAVALNDDDKVIVVHETGTYLSYESYYWLGSVNRVNKTVTWAQKKELLLHSAHELSITVKKDTVIVAFRHGLQHSLHTIIGKLNDANITWAEFDHVPFAQGNWPSISLNAEGLVVVSSQTFVMRFLLCREAVLRHKDGSPYLEWARRDSRTYIQGVYPSVAILEGNRVVEMHGTNKLNGTTLWYFMGFVKE